jgi:transposase InsO family protein
MIVLYMYENKPISMPKVWPRGTGPAHPAYTYNSERPHSSLGYRTPNEFAETLRSSLLHG